MRRLFAILLVVFVPIQLCWSAMESVRGHRDVEGSVAGWHVHHDAAEHADHDLVGDLDHDDPVLAGIADDDRDAGGHPGGHCHPTFSVLTQGVEPASGGALPHGRPSGPLPTFISHIPPPLDWPPVRRS